MATEQKLYPRGQVAMDNGDLADAINIKIDITNNAKQVHTIRQKGAGITMGVEETTVTLDLVISEEGQERDFVKFLKQGTIKQFRVKVPGATFTINGAVKQVGIELPIDDAIKQNIVFIGHMED
jgi:hypothetical protein